MQIKALPLFTCLRILCQKKILKTKQVSIRLNQNEVKRVAFNFMPGILANTITKQKPKFKTEKKF
jgi:hypothetical protein